MFNKGHKYWAEYFAFAEFRCGKFSYCSSRDLKIKIRREWREYLKKGR